MKRVFLWTLVAFPLLHCTRNPGAVCTTEFRMVTVKLKTPAGTPVVLDSFYTVRQSNNQRINSMQIPFDGLYVVLDDSYHGQLQNREDNFRFHGWKNSQLVVNQLYLIGADNCHIFRKSGADSVIVQ